MQKNQLRVEVDMSGVNLTRENRIRDAQVIAHALDAVAVDFDVIRHSLVRLLKLRYDLIESGRRAGKAKHFLDGAHQRFLATRSTFTRTRFPLAPESARASSRLRWCPWSARTPRRLTPSSQVALADLLWPRHGRCCARFWPSSNQYSFWEHAFRARALMAMPETAVNKDHLPAAAENKIGTTGK